jgi:hypothetical protein
MDFLIVDFLRMSVYNYYVHEQGDWWRSNGMSGVIDSPGPDITVAGRYKIHKVETLSKIR